MFGLVLLVWGQSFASLTVLFSELLLVSVAFRISIQPLHLLINIYLSTASEKFFVYVTSGFTLTFGGQVGL